MEIYHLICIFFKKFIRIGKLFILMKEEEKMIIIDLIVNMMRVYIFLRN